MPNRKLQKISLEKSTKYLKEFNSVQFSHSVVSNSLRPHELQHARPPCPSPTPGVYSNSRPSVELVMPSSHLILCRPLLLPPIPPSIRVFSNESTLPMRWPKYWSFSFSLLSLLLSKMGMELLLCLSNRALVPIVRKLWQSFHNQRTGQV